MPSSSSDAASVGNQGVSDQPEKKVYSTKKQYKKYQTREDPVAGGSSGRLGAFKDKLRQRREKKAGVGKSAGKRGIFGGKSYRKLEALKGRAEEAKDVKIARRHQLEQMRARRQLVTKHFGEKSDKWVSKEEYDRKIVELKKKGPWMSAVNDRRQAKEDVKALEQLRDSQSRSRQ